MADYRITEQRLSESLHEGRCLCQEPDRRKSVWSCQFEPRVLRAERLPADVAEADGQLEIV